MCPESWKDQPDCCMRVSNEGKGVEGINLGQMMATGRNAWNRAVPNYILESIN